VPTILTFEGFRFFFYSNEGNEPRHIHIEKGEAAGKYWLNPVLLADAQGFNRAQLARVRELVEEHVEFFQRKWDDHFGK
jgi:hypothetical protein